MMMKIVTALLLLCWMTTGVVAAQDALPIGPAPTDHHEREHGTVVFSQPVTDDSTPLVGLHAPEAHNPLHEQPITDERHQIYHGFAPFVTPAADRTASNRAETPTGGVLDMLPQLSDVPGKNRRPDESSAASSSLDVFQVDGPVGTPDQYAVTNDQTLSIAAPGFLGNDVDLNGEALTATAIVDNVDNGTLAAFADGSFTYAPTAGFSGTDSFVYTMRDASFNVSDPVTVSIDVLPPANRDPIGTPDAYAMLAGTTLSIASPGFLVNDVDLDGEALTATAILDNVDNGTVAAFADGSFTYTPTAGFTGTDSFVYRMRDASFNLSDSVTVTIEVFEGNRAPIGVDDVYATVVNTTLSIAAPGFLTNDLDLDGEALTATAVLDNVDNGTLAAFADGSFSYTPTAGFTGTDSFVYRMRDASFSSSDSVTVIIQVLESGTTPVGMPDHFAVANDQTLSIAAPGLLGNDIDLDGEALTATAILDNVDNGTLAAFADGSFTYTPTAGFTGTDSFVYRMRDASFNSSDSVTVTIDVLPPANRDPIGTPDAYAMLAGTTLSVAAPGFLVNDVDPDGEVLTATAILDNVDNGTLAAFADGSFTYKPTAGFTGTDSFVYRMRDASFNLSDSVTVTIEVFEGNRAPIGLDDAYAMVLNTTLSIAAPGILTNDLDLDGEALTATAVLDNVDNGTLAAFADGSFSYTPTAGFTGNDSFVYRIRDASFNVSDSTAVTIIVLDPDAPPPVPCSITTLTEGMPYVQGGVNKLDISFSNPDGITQIEFSMLENFTATSPHFSETDPVHHIWTGGPMTTVDFTLAQVDPQVPAASYFAIASSVCPNEQDGTLETDFDPSLAFPEAPLEFVLAQNYPNPFNPVTTIAFALPAPEHVRLTVHDALGRVVAVLMDRELEAGRHTVEWNSRDSLGSPAASGLYLYRIEAGSFMSVRRMTLLK